MRNRTWRILMFGLVAVVCSFTLTLLAVEELHVFELEGDASEDSATSWEDWQTVNASGPYLGPALARAFVAELHGGVGPDPTAFFNKQTKDTVDIPGNWTYKATNVPDKDDINNAYAAAYSKDGDIIITFGADRFSSGNGTAYLGFWFFQATVAPGPGGNFTGRHTPGDVLVLVNFEGGGDTPNIQILEWAPGAGDVATDLLQVFNNSSKCEADADSDACAITNMVETTLYWPFDYKNTPSCGGPTCKAPAQAFFEGAVNLTAIFEKRGKPMPCITSFLAETRSSSSVSADLKDFVAGDFKLCGISIGISCGSAQSDGYKVTLQNNIKVKNTGVGTLYDAVVIDTIQTDVSVFETRYYAADCSLAKDPGACEVISGLAELAAGSEVIFAAFPSWETTLPKASESVDVEAASSSGGDRTILGDEISANCGITPTGTVTVTKVCDPGAELVLEGDVLKVKVTVSGTITNEPSSSTAIEITSIEDVPDPGITITPVKSTLGIGESTTYKFSYYPTTLPGSTCGGTGKLCWTDMITIHWKGVLGGSEDPLNPTTNSATCSLCPPCQPEAGPCPAGK